MKFSLVVAMDKNRGIGINGQLPWHLSADLKYFAKLTKTTKDSNKKNAVIMGRKTWESIPDKYRPLPDRHNIVLTRNENYDLPDGVTRAHSLDEALEMAKASQDENVFVIGGGNVFGEAMKHEECTTFYVTEILKNFECDTFFNEIPEDEYVKEILSGIEHEKDIEFQFVKYERKALV
jgi:dihydrofolate reductase